MEPTPPGDGRSPRVSPADFGPAPPGRRRRHWGMMLGLAALALAPGAGCSGRQESPAQRAAAARTLFEQAAKDFHFPSVAARGAEQRRLQDQAAAAYQALLKQYPDQADWAAPALRNLGNLRAAQTNLDEAVRLFAAVEQRYPQQEWENLMALKTAADLLWDAGRRDEARTFYRKIVTRFDKAGAAAVVKTVVRGSKSRLVDSAAAAPP